MSELRSSATGMKVLTKMKCALNDSGPP